MAIPEYRVEINPADLDDAIKIAEEAARKAKLEPDATIQVEVNPSVSLTRPSSARLKQIYAIEGGPVEEAQITS